MSNQDEDTVAPVEPTETQKPIRKRAKPKKKAVEKPKPTPRKRKAAVKKKVKPNRPAKAKAKAKPKRKTRKALPKARIIVRGRVKGKVKRKKARVKGKPAIRKKLYKLLKAKLPKKFKFKDGHVNLKMLIKALKMTPEGVYKWLRSDHMAAANALRLVKVTRKRIKLVDLIPFVFDL